MSGGRAGDETAAAMAEAGADATEVDFREDRTMVAEPSAGQRTWSKDEVAELARNFEGDTDPHRARVRGDPVLKRLIANLGRRSRPPSGPIPERANSEGGDYVVYGATAAPAAPRDEPQIGPRVLVQGSDATTALLPGRRRKWTRTMLGVARPLVLVVFGAAAGAIGYRWIETPDTAPVRSGVLEHAVGSLVPAGSVLEQPQGSPSVSRVERQAAGASASAEPGAAHGQPSSGSSANRASVRMQAPLSNKRTLDAAVRKASGNANQDDVMEPVEY